MAAGGTPVLVRVRVKCPPSPNPNPNLNPNPNPNQVRWYTAPLAQIIVKEAGFKTLADGERVEVMLDVVREDVRRDHPEPYPYPTPPYPYPYPYPYP